MLDGGESGEEEKNATLPSRDASSRRENKSSTF